MLLANGMEKLIVDLSDVALLKSDDGCQVGSIFERERPSVDDVELPGR